MEINQHAPATAVGELQQTVWAVLSAIEQWPSWNPDVKSVQLQGRVQPATVFRWKAGPSTLTSTLQVVDPPHELALKRSGRRTLDRGIHNVLERLKAVAERRTATP